MAGFASCMSSLRRAGFYSCGHHYLDFDAFSFLNSQHINMLVSPLIIYLWQLADSLRTTLALISLLTGFAAFGVTLFWRVEEVAKAKKFVILLWLLFSALLGLHTVIPSSKTIAMMVVIPAITNSEAVQKDLPEIYDLAVKSLKESLTK